jgi:hypothetical protein
MKLRKTNVEKSDYPAFHKYYDLKLLFLGVSAVAMINCTSHPDTKETSPELPKTVNNNSSMVDTDGDGIIDINDNCISLKEDMDGFEDKDGCPDLDNDKDGIVDKKDKCPNRPETKNGYLDLDGCLDNNNPIQVDGGMGKKVRPPRRYLPRRSLPRRSLPRRSLTT